MFIIYGVCYHEDYIIYFVLGYPSLCMQLLGNKKNKYELSLRLSAFFQEHDTLAWCKLAYTVLEFVYLLIL